MIENSPELAKRAQVYKDKIVVPGTQSTIRALPADPDSLEGLDFSLCLLDESGVVDPRTYEVLADSQGKRKQSTLVLIGTPGLSEDSPLARVRDYCRDNPDDPLVSVTEHSAAGFESHPVDCLHCWKLANPGLGDYLHVDGLRAALPPKTTEARFRRVRLCQWVVGGAETYIDAGSWAQLADAQRVPLPGAPVVLGLDGSRTDDATAVVGVTIEERPIVFLMGLWTPTGDGYRIPVLQVEQVIRAAADIYNVREIVCDPYGWARTIEVLRDEGLPVVEMPNTRPRMIPATSAFREAVYQKELTHDANPSLAEHVSNARMVQHSTGFTVSKPAPKSAKKIDACVAAIMAHSRARWHVANPPKPRHFRIFKMS